MADRRFLLVRLGSLGDIVHTLPAAAALRDTFPGARVDWVVDAKWARVLEGNPDLSEVIELDRRSPQGLMGVVRRLRAAKYTSAVDFQALYKSALLAFASGAPERIGFESSYAREGMASLFYTDRLNPRGAHKVEHNLTLVERAGARLSKLRFPLAVHPGDHERISCELAAHRQMGSAGEAAGRIRTWSPPLTYPSLARARGPLGRPSAAPTPTLGSALGHRGSLGPAPTSALPRRDPRGVPPRPGVHGTHRRLGPPLPREAARANEKSMG